MNMASQMESKGEPSKIQVTADSAALLRNSGYTAAERGGVEVKGKGTVTTFWLQSSNPRGRHRIES